MYIIQWIIFTVKRIMEINKAIVKLKVDKAFKTNQIFNRVIKMLRKTLTKRPIFISQACIDVEYHSKSFRKAKILVLKKIRKSDYTEWSLKKKMRRQSFSFLNAKWEIEKKEFPSHTKCAIFPVFYR